MLTPVTDRILAGMALVRTGDWDYGVMPATVEVAPHPAACAVCVTGCDCETGTPGCIHYGCWGRDADASRPGVAAMSVV
jgi:hypothetical protein